MSLQDDIFAWMGRQAPWKQELYLRAAVAPEVEAADIEAVAAILLEDSQHPAPRQVTRENLPRAHHGGAPFQLHSLSELRSANLIPDGQRRPWQGRSDWRAIYRRAGDFYVILAIDRQKDFAALIGRAEARAQQYDRRLKADKP